MYFMIYLFCLLALAASSGIPTTHHEESSHSGGHGVYGGGGHGYSEEDERKQEDDGLSDFDFGGDWNGLDLDFARFHLGGGDGYFGRLGELGELGNIFHGLDDQPEIRFRHGADGLLIHGYDSEQNQYHTMGYPHPVIL